MNLFVLRHASAGTRRSNPLLDAKRPLDREGKQHCLQLAYVLNALNISFDLIVSSPLKRSLQTAQLIATETGYEAGILHSNALAPDASIASFDRLVQEYRERENLLVVGHSPNIQLFLSSLLTRKGAGDPAGAHGRNGASAAGPQLEAKAGDAPQIRMRKGAIARVVLTRGPGTLQALLDPRLVRALYATSTKSSRRKTSRK